MSKVVLLDNGHGLETAGKCSPLWPDGKRLIEAEFSRDMVNRIIAKACKEDIGCIRLVPEQNDVTLGERCRRANAYYDRFGGECIVVSIHANGGGGTGFEVFTSPGKTKADAIATAMYEHLERDFPEQRMRKDMSDGDPDKESKFYILVHTKAPAILVENLFMDTEKDCRLLMDESFRDRLADTYVEFLKQVTK